MDRATNQNKPAPVVLNEGFDCIKMRNLISKDSKQSFTKKFRAWIDSYTKTSKEKIWTDVEYYKSW